MADKPAMHGRDHCPGGSDPLPCWPDPEIATFEIPWARLYSLNSDPHPDILGNSTPVTVEFDRTQIHDAASNFFENDLTAPLQTILIKTKGYYMIRWVYLLGETGSAPPATYAVRHRPVISGANNGAASQIDYYTGTGLAALGNRAASWHARIRAGHFVSLAFEQNSTVTLEFHNRMLEVARLGDYGGPNSYSGSLADEFA